MDSGHPDRGEVFILDLETANNVYSRIPENHPNSQNGIPNVIIFAANKKSNSMPFNLGKWYF